MTVLLRHCVAPVSNLFIDLGLPQRGALTGTQRPFLHPLIHPNTLEMAPHSFFDGQPKALVNQPDVDAERCDLLLDPVGSPRHDDCQNSMGTAAHGWAEQLKNRAKTTGRAASSTLIRSGLEWSGELTKKAGIARPIGR